MSDQVVLSVAVRVVADVKLPKVVVAGGEPGHGELDRTKAHAIIVVSCPLFDAVVVAGNHVVEAVVGTHDHASAGVCRVQEDAGVAAHLARTAILEANPFAIDMAGGRERRAIPLNAGANLENDDFCCH